MGFGYSKCASTARLDGKTVIVTGSNTGIGKCTAEDLFKRGARVIMACRNLEKANAAADEIKERCKDLDSLGQIVITELDLCSLASIRQCATKLLDSEERIDILINNAGVMTCPKSKTEDGFERQFGTNHLGHFLFTMLLLPRLIRSAPARIINLSSLGHESGEMNFDDLHFEKRPYAAYQAYTQSKLAIILFAKELARKLEEANIEDVHVYSVNPGEVFTELGRHLDETYFRGFQWIVNHTYALLMITPEQGAQTTLHCALDEDVGKETGLYYEQCKVKKSSKASQSIEDAQKLWDCSVELVGLDKNYNPFIAK